MIWAQIEVIRGQNQNTFQNRVSGTDLEMCLYRDQTLFGQFPTIRFLVIS